MATLSSTPRLSIDPAPVAGQRRVTVRYDIQFDAFDRAADQPYLETVALIGDDTGVAGDPLAAAPDDRLQVISTGTVRASMNGGGTLARNHVRLVALSALDEDRVDAPDPDEIRAVVSLRPQAPSALTVESNLVRIGAAPPRVAVPNVIGAGEDGARNEIEAAGLVADLELQEPNPLNKPWRVVSQDPQPGTRVPVGSVVSAVLRPLGGGF